MPRLSLLLLAPFALFSPVQATAADAAHHVTVKPRLSLQMNYQAADALLDSLAKRKINDDQIAGLLQIKSVRTMVDNTTKYVPSHTHALFADAMKEYVRTRKSTIGPAFRLGESADQAPQIRSLITRLKNDRRLRLEITRPLVRYLPPIPPVTATVYGVVGGASDGFVVDNDPEPAFYMALNRAEGDAAGVKLNMTHELYHVVQRIARNRVPGLSARIFDAATAPAPVRLMTLVYEEGSATYVARPMLGTARGPYIDMWREAYAKNMPRKRIVANFAQFDRVLKDLKTGRMTWDQASNELFTGTGAPLYFVGYEVTKALDARDGPGRVGAFAQQHPAAFFRRYIELYRKCPACVPARFSRATEAYIYSLTS
ncbi:MAG: DUF5700 domain-containing putative Zn-dependent protease [Sphingomicrobium sp.]